MNRSIRNILYSVLLVVLMQISALAIDYPHEVGSVKGYNCLSCHSSHVSLGTTGYDNICLSCHKGSDPYAGNKPFTPADFANPFKTFTGARPGNATQTSHKWMGSDTVSAAGAVPPLNADLNKANMRGTISCARCHSVHDYTADPAYPTMVPLLRTANNQDQMCVDCHRPRNSRNHMTGTHPINFTYTSATSKVKTDPTHYYSTPVNANPANPTSAIKLVNGKILCSSCHGVHYTDSNSRTFDTHSSAKFGKLSTSTGLLLRTDLRGGTANATNICTNCHTNKFAHNGKSQNVQCADCHAGHVDYDPAAVTSQEKVPNVYLVRRYMNISTTAGAVRNKKVFYQYTGSQKNYRDGSGTGVCQACHAIPAPGGIYPPEHASSDPNVCKNCHGHNAPSGSFSGGCSSCHGYPPPAAAAGYSALTEANTPHTSHAGGTQYGFACTECHKGNNHSGGTFQDVFIDKTGIIAGATAAYNTGTRGCATVYCHSDGAGGYKAGQNPITWGTNKGSIIGQPGECNTCHDAEPATNRHTKHVSVASGKGYGCVICHAATVSNNTTLLAAAKASGGTHVNTVKNILFSGPLATGSNCANIYCHSNGKGTYASPTWASVASGACGTCHATTPVIGGATLINTNAHFMHFSSAANSYGPMLTQQNVTSCQTCHTYTTELAATHVDGTVNQPGANCTTSCHKQGAIWTAGPVTCASCHTGSLSVIGGITAPDKSLFATEGHGKAGIAKACLDCHDRNKRHINKDAAVHNTRLINSLIGVLNIECNFCHTDPAKVINPAKRDLITHVSTRGGAADAKCSKCHDVHGSKAGQLFGIYSSIYAPTNVDIAGNGINKRVVFTNTSTGFINSTRTGICQVCHTKTNHFRNYTAASYTAYGQPYISTHPTKNCLSCHDHKAVFAFKPAGECNTCHGYPPVASMAGLGVQNNYTAAKLQDYTNGGGAHAVTAHVKLTARPSEGWTNCAICHSAGSLSPATHLMSPTPPPQTNVTVSVDPAYKFNSAQPITYSGPLNGSNTTGSCSNVSCHFKASPIWAP